MKVSEDSNPVSGNFERISLLHKIEINKLQSKKDEIIIVASKLNVVEEAKKILNDPVPCIGSIIQHYIKTYSDATLKNTDQIDVYSCIVKSLMALVGAEYETHIEYVLVYIIDRCEIFEKV